MSELDKNTLLPDNRTTFERSYEEGVKDLVKGEDVHQWISDPLKTKIELLDLMAKERGVNDWFFSDSEQAKRAITQASYSVHQLSGTHEGIKQALDAVDYTAQITHWKQVEGGLPYTVHVMAWGNSHQTVTKERADRFIERLNHVKSEKDTIDLSLVFAVSQSFSMKAAASPSVSFNPTEAKMELWELDLTANAALAIGHTASVTVHPMSVKAQLTQPDLIAYTGIGSAFSPQPLSVTHIYATARLP
ncbi:hypothetical protein G6Z94_11810 [Vibrio aestuarianus]|uniref:phage tail protein n=1 Tax=Vibrio aestuarianus TaxID=28171 RepID=UPI00159417B3|nr:phage tail protein [Vibrio aestuarianus]NGZ18025.1 hypothetical protein [Vibrio aestuarianus]